MGNTVSTKQTVADPNQHICGKHATIDRKSTGNGGNAEQSPTNGGSHENSRILFLLYLINRTWNVMTDGGNGDKLKSKSNRSNQSVKSQSQPSTMYDEGFETDMNFTDLDDESSLYGSQYSFCSCSYCYESKTFGRLGARMSFCESDITYNFFEHTNMTPSAGKNAPGTQTTSNDILDYTNNFKEINQRPPVYNAEDYIASLKKYGRRPAGSKSVYDTTQDQLDEQTKLQLAQSHLDSQQQSAHTLPRKTNKDDGYRINPIKTPPENDMEMSLKQFGSITDLLTKLRADLRASFPSFVQEFVASPMDGTSILLEVLRAIQLSQTLQYNTGGTGSAPSSLVRNSQSFQRRALLDELACLQCLSLCVARSPEAGARLGTTPIGLLPLAAAATGLGIRSRIIALQLLSAACDKNAIGNGNNRNNGYTAVSEALSTLRLRCGEPVRFRLLVGMLNSGGGTGELQAVGLKFINTFLESADTTQNRLYLQAELFQAGFDAPTMTKTIASSSAWLEKLRNEVKKWEELRIDVGRLQIQARESEKLRSQLVVLERRCQIMHEEKSVLTSMERRLQERCAELQREVFRLQGNRTESQSTNSLEKPPIALPRQVPPGMQNKHNSSSEHDDEGISSSETGPSMSPEPERTFPKKESNSISNSQQTLEMGCIARPRPQDNMDDTNATIEDVIDELHNIVSDAEREISLNKNNLKVVSIATTHATSEDEILPVNLLPQPPRKSRSLVHLLSNPSEGDGSDYGLVLVQDGANKMTFFDETKTSMPKVYTDDRKHEQTTAVYYNDTDMDLGPDLILNRNTNQGYKDPNRAILNVIMDAREMEENDCHDLQKLMSPKDVTNGDVVIPPAQNFNGVFFMSEMNSAHKYPKPDITAALEAKRVTKNLDRMGAYGLDSMIDIVLTSDKSKNSCSHNSNINMNNSNNSSNHNTNSNFITGNKIQPFKIRTGHCNAGMYSGKHLLRDNSRNSNPSGSKVTDIPSGLY